MARWALSSFSPKWFCLLLPQFSYLSLLFLYFSLFTVHSKVSQPRWTILNSLPPWVGARREEKLRGLLWLWATYFELEGWPSTGAVDPEGDKGDSSSCCRKEKHLWWTLLIPCVPESNRIGDNESPWLPKGGRGGVRISELRTSALTERLVFHRLPFSFPCLQGCILIYRRSKGVAEGPEFPQAMISSCIQTVTSGTEFRCSKSHLLSLRRSQ